MEVPASLLATVAAGPRKPHVLTPAENAAMELQLRQDPLIGPVMRGMDRIERLTFPLARRVGAANHSVRRFWGRITFLGGDPFKSPVHDPWFDAVKRLANAGPHSAHGARDAVPLDPQTADGVRQAMRHLLQARANEADRNERARTAGVLEERSKWPWGFLKVAGSRALVTVGTVGLMVAVDALGYIFPLPLHELIRQTVDTVRDSGYAADLGYAIGASYVSRIAKDAIGSFRDSHKPEEIGRALVNAARERDDAQQLAQNSADLARTIAYGGRATGIERRIGPARDIVVSYHELTSASRGDEIDAALESGDALSEPKVPPLLQPPPSRDLGTPFELPGP
jgi:hypothetical protein